MVRKTRVHLGAIAVIMLAICPWGCSRSNEVFATNRNELPGKIKTVLETSESFVLLSLDPSATPDTTEIFHDYKVLGKVDIKDKGERAEILQALHQGIADASGNVLGCFNPRHGISATLGGERVELVICFECLSMVVYTKETNGLLTARAPENIFNKVLAKARVPIAGK